MMANFAANTERKDMIEIEWLEFCLETDSG